MATQLPDTLEGVRVYFHRAKPKNGQAMRLKNSFRKWFTELTWYEATQDPQMLKNGQDRLIAFDAANGGSSVGADTPTSMPVLKPGSTGDAVRLWQKGIGAPITGTFDTNTQNLTKAWQKSKGLKADGIVGAGSWGTVPLSTTYMAKVSTVVTKVMNTLKGNAGTVAVGAAIGVGAAIVASRK